MIIAVDGPAASGKGTIARALAAHYALPYLDTGLLYRAVGMTVALSGGDPDDAADALAGCNFAEDIFTNPILRDEATGSLASRVSVHPAVRAALNQRQRDFALQPGGAVLDGRDIGTVIAPDADVKLFITASALVRAQRRLREMGGNDDALTALVVEIEARDARDMNRPNAPLAMAKDAALLDTSDLTIGQSVQRAIALVDAHMEGQPTR